MDGGRRISQPRIKEKRLFHIKRKKERNKGKRKRVSLVPRTVDEGGAYYCVLMEGGKN